MRRWRLGFTLVSLAALLWLAPPHAIMAVLATAEPRWVIAGVMLSLAATLLSAAIFRGILALRGIDARYGAVLAANLAGDFYSLSLPGGLAVGGAVRLIRLGRDGRGMSGVLAAIVVSRVQEMLLQLSLALLAMCWILGRLPAAGSWAAVIGLGTLATAGIYLALFNRTCRRWGFGLMTRWLPRRSRRAGRLRRLLVRAGRVRQVGALAHARLLAMGVLRHLLGAAAFLAFAAAAGVELGLAPALWTRGVTGITMLLPLSVAGLGLRELSYVALLGIFGVPPATALAVSLMVFATLLLNAAAGGLIELGSAVRPVARGTAPDRP